MTSVWLNGAFVDEADASVPLRDTGLLHAAGVFTTVRSYGRRVFRLDQHLARVRRSCEALFIPLQYRDEELAAAVDEIHRRNELDDTDDNRAYADEDEIELQIDREELGAEQQGSDRDPTPPSHGRSPLQARGLRVDYLGRCSSSHVLPVYS